jgi:protein ImuB
MAPSPSAGPHWDALPRALAEGTRLRAVSLAAGRAGVRAGMTVAEARGQCPALEVRPWDGHAVDDAILAVTTALLEASPQVTPVAGAPGLWWVGAGGFAALGGEPALAASLLAIARRWHPDARVAIADSCVAARAATWAPRPRDGRVTHDARAAHRARTHDARNRDARLHDEQANAARVHDARSARHVDAFAMPVLRDPAVTIVAPGGCAAYLAPAPLGLVPMGDDVRDALQALGLHTAGALAALAPADVERQWGAEGLLAWRLARGEDPRRPGLMRVAAVRSAGVELPAPAEGAAPVLFVLRALLERLVRELVEDGRAAAAVAVTLVLDAGRYGEQQLKTERLETRDWRRETVAGAGHGAMADGPPGEPPVRLPPRDLLAVPHRTVTREVRPARPMARLEPLFDQCRALLERWTVSAPVIGVTLSVPATAPLAADQGDLLVPSWRDAAMTADSVFARLRAALDPEGAGDVVVTPEAGDAHRPEHRGRWAPADARAIAMPAHHPAPTTSSPPASPPPSAPRDRRESRVSSPESPSLRLQLESPVLRLLDAPEPVEVELADGLPNAVWWRGRRHTVGHADGPERLSGDWWRPDAFARDYWRCDVGGEGTLLLYREAGGWQLQGWYD